MNTSAMMTTHIRENFEKVMERIAWASNRAGRGAGEVRLVVVTKTHPPDVIQAVIEAGATDLGENYIEEAIPKILYFGIGKGINWHMVGHVQSRKATLVIEYFQALHSLDSVKLAERLSRFAGEQGKILPIFLEINVSGETSKCGWDIRLDEDWPKIVPEIERILNLPRLNISGFMTIPPYSINPEDSRPFYQRLRQFQEYVIKRLQTNGLRELSMGMSSDFEVAIQEGSTCVRIGQAILGPRGMKKERV